MAKYYYRLDNMFEWQASSGNAIVAFVNPLGSNKIITFRNIEAVPITTIRSIIPFVFGRVTNVIGGEQVDLVSVTGQGQLPSGFRVFRNCGADGTPSVIRRSTEWWRIVTPASSNPATLSPLGLPGIYLSKRIRNYFYDSISSAAEAITIRNNEYFAVVGQFSGYVTPVMVDVEFVYSGNSFSTSFFALLSGDQNLCPIGIINTSGQAVRLTKLEVKPVGTSDTPFLRIVPIAGIQFEALNAFQNRIPSSFFVKYNTTSPDISTNVLLAYKNVGVIPYGVPVEYASAGGTANPRGANYLHTKDFIGPDYMVFFPEVRTASVGLMRDDFGITMSKKFSIIKKDIVLRSGDGMAIVSSAETLASWGGTASWGINFGFDIEIADVEYKLSLINIKQNSEVRIFRAGTQIELAGVENIGVNGIFEYTYVYTPNTYVDIVIHHLDYLYYRIDNYQLTAADVSIPISQQKDRQYKNP